MKDYWTQEVEEALGKYVRSEDNVEKNKIFDDYLHVPFRKLIDDVFKRYRLPVVPDDEVKLDALSSLVMRVERFNPEVESRSSKPSGWVYCNILVRSWMADYRLKTSKEKKNVRFEECHEIHLNKI